MAKRLTMKERRAADKARAVRHTTKQRELGRSASTRWVTAEEREGLDTWLQAFREANGST